MSTSILLRQRRLQDRSLCNMADPRVQAKTVIRITCVQEQNCKKRVGSGRGMKTTLTSGFGLDCSITWGPLGMPATGERLWPLTLARDLADLWTRYIIHSYIILKCIALIAIIVELSALSWWCPDIYARHIQSFASQLPRHAELEHQERSTSDYLSRYLLGPLPS